MGSTHKRSLTKGIIWEASMFILATIIIYIWSGNLVGSIGVNLFILAIKSFLYYVNERAWKKIKWGKI